MSETSTHFEAPASQEPVPDVADGFVVEIASTGQRFHIPENDSIIEVLADAGIHIDTSCTSGLCASCKVRYVSGEVDHRDLILSDEEREHFLTCCVSRAKSGLLVLDL